MDHFFVSDAKVRRYFEAPDGVDVDGREVLSRPGALPDGTPFVVDASMRPVEPLCSYFFEMSKHVGAKTLADYAYDLIGLVEFLAVLEPPVDLVSATEDDLVAYRLHRTVRQDTPVAAATWRCNRAAINGFYTWAVTSGSLPAKPYVARANGRDALSWGSVNTLDVRHLSHPQWQMLHRVGLGGLRPDGDVDPAFRGRDRLRNMAAGELAVTTGMRLREFTCLLDIEVGPPRPDATGAPVLLQAVAKYGIARQAVIGHPVLRSIDLYRRTERAVAVEATRRTLARRAGELFVVDDVDESRMRLRGRLHGRRREFAISAMPAPLRRLTVIDRGRGPEPMALFVGARGVMPGKSRWEQIFAAAAARARAAAPEAGVVMPARVRIHDTRHTFAVFMLAILTRLVVREENERRAGGSAYVAGHVARNPLLTVQRLLGHRSPATTYRYLYYLEQTEAIVARALEEWTDADTSWADQARIATGSGVR
ncbi:site-specific integrase [Embleya sp. NPDC008237]|uniref:site-specific integrase n=1 Tax=Embleya sp. NPDC008237 TaxID=3363978 RepID=UPI0036E9C222